MYICILFSLSKITINDVKENAKKISTVIKMIVVMVMPVTERVKEWERWTVVFCR